MQALKDSLATSGALLGTDGTNFPKELQEKNGEDENSRRGTVTAFLTSLRKSFLLALAYLVKIGLF